MPPTKIDDVWESTTFGILFTVVGLTLAGYWIFFTPSTGKAVGALAVAAAVMTLRPKMEWLEKFLWIAVLFVFLFIEVRAIDKDRRESNTAQLAAQRDQNQKFSEILKNNQTEFDATMKRMEGLAKLSKESVDSVTGGRDFVSVEIIPIPVDKDGVSLLAVLNGKHAVREVSYSMNEGRPPYIPTETELNETIAGRVPANVTQGNIGTIAPGLNQIFRVVHPSLKDGGYYNINISALNGRVNEKLEVRFESERHRWNRRFTVTRDDKIIKTDEWYK